VHQGKDDGGVSREEWEDLISSLYRFFLRWTGSPQDAEDLTGEVLVRLLAKYRGKNIKELRRLAFRIARNLLVDWYRKKKNKPRIFPLNEADAVVCTDEVSDVKNTAGSEAESKGNGGDKCKSEEGKMLHRRFCENRMRREEKLEVKAPKFIPYCLHKFEEMSGDDIAYRLEIERNTVYQRISRAKAVLREYADKARRRWLK